MSSTREIKVTVNTRNLDGREPETTQGVIAKHDAELAARQAELEEAITFLRLQVNDIKAQRELLSLVEADIALVEAEIEVGEAD
jgi:hypothetical protein